MGCWAHIAARHGALIAIAVVTLSGCKRGDSTETASIQPDEVADELDDAGNLAAAAVEAPDEAQPTITDPFLWEVRAPDSEDKGYLFGTMHLGVDAEASLPEIVFERLAAADIYAMEADLTDMSIASMLMRDDGTTLSEEIGETAWEKLESIVGRLQARGLDQMKAGAAAMTLIAKPLPTTPPMDLVLLQRARDADLEIAYLEDASFQVELLLRYINTDVLLQVLEDWDEVVELSARGLEAYISGDEEALLEFLFDPASWESAPEGAQEAFLDERNKAWVPQIEEMLGRGTPFVAVGAGHLVGDNSVIDLLTQNGYEIQRIQPD